MIELDDDIADGITLATLKEHLKMANDFLEKFENGGYLHPDDVVSNMHLVRALKVVIDYFGG